MRIFYIFFVFLTLIFKDPLSLDFEQLETKSGIKFWLVEDNSLPLVSLSFSFKGGALADGLGKEGTTNLMTSLLDEGTDGFTAENFKLSMRENGVKISFSSRKEKVEGTLQVVKSQLQEGFWLLHEAVNNPIFKTNEINKVKKQLVASIKIDESNISTLASDKFEEYFFNDKKMKRKVKGSVRSINNISRQDLIESHKKIFCRNNVYIGIAGSINKDLAKKYIDYVFGSLPLKNTKNFQPNVSVNKGSKIINVDSPQSTVIFGQRGVGRNDPNYFSARILNYVLGGGGFQSRLYKEVREKKGLVYSIYSYLRPYEEEGIIIGGFQTRNKTVKETMNKVIDEWKKISKNGITKNDLNDAKTYYKGSFSRNYTNTLSISKLLTVVQYYSLGEDYFKKRNQIIDQINLNEINNYASTLFDPESLYFMIVGKPDI